MMERDPFLDSLLDEMLNERRAPDLSERIMNAARERSLDPETVFKLATDDADSPSNAELDEPYDAVINVCLLDSELAPTSAAVSSSISVADTNSSKNPQPKGRTIRWILASGALIAASLAIAVFSPRGLLSSDTPSTNDTSFEASDHPSEVRTSADIDDLADDSRVKILGTDQPPIETTVEKIGDSPLPKGWVDQVFPVGVPEGVKISVLPWNGQDEPVVGQGYMRVLFEPPTRKIFTLIDENNDRLITTDELPVLARMRDRAIAIDADQGIDSTAFHKHRRAIGVAANLRDLERGEGPKLLIAFYGEIQLQRKARKALFDYYAGKNEHFISDHQVPHDWLRRFIFGGEMVATDRDGWSYHFKMDRLVPVGGSAAQGIRPRSSGDVALHGTIFIGECGAPIDVDRQFAFSDRNANGVIEKGELNAPFFHRADRDENDEVSKAEYMYVLMKLIDLREAHQKPDGKQPDTAPEKND